MVTIISPRQDSATVKYLLDEQFDEGLLAAITILRTSEKLEQKALGGEIIAIATLIRDVDKRKQIIASPHSED